MASRISRDRFFELHRYLHFADNSSLSPPGDPGYNKVGKVQPVIDHLGEAFRSVYCLPQNVSVDEAMIPFKGRSSLKQYIPLKLVKRGIKVWGMSDASNGYIAGFEVYTGKKGDRVEKDLGASVVKTLAMPYKNTYRHIYFDNYFCSIALLINLLKLGLYGCGTIQTNRNGFPQPLKMVAKKGLGERGMSKTYQCGKLTATVWQDKKPGAVVATNSDPKTPTQVFRKNKDGTRDLISYPQSLALYNKFMGGVDRNDQLQGYYHVRLKCRKFYKYIFWFLFDAAITNSYILYHHYVDKPDIQTGDLKTFRVELAKSLISDYCSRKRPGRLSTSVPTKRFCQAHFPTKGAEKGRRCYYCYTYNHVRHETVWYCRDCNHFLCHTGKENDWNLFTIFKRLARTLRSY